MPHLFTYGTLMFPEVWEIVVGRKFETRRATLAGYEICRIKNAVYPGIASLSSNPQISTFNSRLTSVPGLLYFDIDPESLSRLDRFEGEEYRRLEVEVTTSDSEFLAADTYVVPPENRHLLTDEIWTADEFAARGDLERFVAKYGGFQRLP